MSVVCVSLNLFQSYFIHNFEILLRIDDSYGLQNVQFSPVLKVESLNCLHNQELLKIKFAIDYLDVFSAKIVHEIPRVTCEQQAFLAMDDRLAAWRRHKFRADCKPIGARIVALENCG